MSQKATAWAWRQHLPAVQKLVLLALADRHVDNPKNCVFSLSRVAEDTGLDNAELQGAIRALQLEDFLAMGRADIYACWDENEKKGPFTAFTLALPKGLL